MKAFIVIDKENIPVVVIRDGNRTIKNYVFKLDKKRFTVGDVLDPLNWYESDYSIRIPRENKGVFVVGSELWYAMNVYKAFLSS